MANRSDVKSARVNSQYLYFHLFMFNMNARRWPNSEERGLDDTSTESRRNVCPNSLSDESEVLKCRNENCATLVRHSRRRAHTKNRRLDARFAAIYRQLTQTQRSLFTSGSLSSIQRYRSGKKDQERLVLQDSVGQIFDHIVCRPFDVCRESDN